MKHSFALCLGLASENWCFGLYDCFIKCFSDFAEERASSTARQHQKGCGQQARETAVLAPCPREGEQVCVKHPTET